MSSVLSTAGAGITCAIHRIIYQWRHLRRGGVDKKIGHSVQHNIHYYVGRNKPASFYHDRPVFGSRGNKYRKMCG